MMRKEHKDGKREERVAPRAAKRLRQLAREEQANAFAALCVGTIDATVRANDETVQVVDQTRIARFGARDGEIGGGATINAAQLAHFFTSQPPERRAVKQLEQVLEPLPCVFALIDESIRRHHKQDCHK